MVKQIRCIVGAAVAITNGWLKPAFMETACQKLDIAGCDEDTVIKFEDFGPARLNQKVRLAYKNSTGSGCIGIHRSAFREDVDTVGKTEELDIPPLLKSLTGPVEEVLVMSCFKYNGSLCKN